MIPRRAVSVRAVSSTQAQYTVIIEFGQIRCMCLWPIGRYPRRPDGIFVALFEQWEIGPDLFRKACEFGLESLVSKRRDGAYRAARRRTGSKVKNSSHPAMQRVKDVHATLKRKKGPAAQ